MDWERIEANWKQFRGAAKAHWFKLTDEQLELAAGKRDVLAGKIQEAYGYSREETDKQLSAWADLLRKRPSALWKRPR
jgi:uncharacterized protein YjbJ (UPF0337 family)